MITSKINKNQLEDFYQSKFEYFRVVGGYSAILIGLLETTYYISDCLLFGGFQTETLLSRFAILIPLIIFCYLYPTIKSYKYATILYYFIPHASMWCTIWSIYYLPNRDFAREGFIIMHFAFLAIGLAMPLKYHIPIHGLLILNIIISNIWIHYEYFAIMISLAIPLYIGVIIMLWILENSYADQYLIKKKLELSSISDELTGVYNRHKVEEIVDEDTQKLKLKKDVIILMIDVDYFKRVNDNYGHEAGDAVLKFVASELKSQVYGRDYVIRWGGEEFVVILVGYSKEQARALSEKFRSDVENAYNGICPITISIGIYKYLRNDTFHEAVEKADKALYYAKEHGRNQVVDYAEI